MTKFLLAALILALLTLGFGIFKKKKIVIILGIIALVGVCAVFVLLISSLYTM